jgi:hypothetical protein
MNEICGVCGNVILGSCVYVPQLSHLNYFETQFKYNYVMFSELVLHIIWKNISIISWTLLEMFMLFM